MLDQEITSFTLILPKLPDEPPELRITTLVVERLLDNMTPVKLPPIADIVKSVGSIIQLPILPLIASVVIFALSAILTCDALVSIFPPFPPLGALASNVPLILLVPAVVPASKVITPFLFCNVCAEITPVLLTTLANKLFLAPALIMTAPPSA